MQREPRQVAAQRANPHRDRGRTDVQHQLARQLGDLALVGHAADVDRGGGRPGVGGEQRIAAPDVLHLHTAQVDGDPGHRTHLLLVLAQALQTAYPDQPVAELQLISHRQQSAAQGAGDHRAGPADGEGPVHPQPYPTLASSRWQRGNQPAEGGPELR